MFQDQCKCQRDIGLVVDAWIATFAKATQIHSSLQRYTDSTNLLHVTGSNEKTPTLWAIDYAHTVAIKAKDNTFGSEYVHTSVSGSTIAQPTYTVV